MDKALLEYLPEKTIAKVMQTCLKASTHTATSEHWSEAVPDTMLYQGLLNFYFPDEKDSLAPILDKLDEQACLSMLLHGIAFRYGHLEGIQKQYLLAVLSQDYETQQRLLDEDPVACLTTCYVSERGSDE